MSELAQQIRAVMERPTGFGIFSTVVDVPGKGRTRYWFSLASGLASMHDRIEYRTRFAALPDWVSFCHPEQVSGLCRLALRTNEALPPEPPL